MPPPEVSGIWRRPMTSRDRTEEHRASTPLELLYDLCFVVAIAPAASLLHHAISHGAAGSAVVSYLLVFFAIGWAWMNFTWFAPAYDNDDAVYRLLVFLQMVGVLVLAAGVPRAFTPCSTACAASTSRRCWRGSCSSGWPRSPGSPCS